MTYPTSSLPVHAVAHIYPAELHHQSHQERDSAQSLFHLHHLLTWFLWAATWKLFGVGWISDVVSRTSWAPRTTLSSQSRLCATQTLGVPAAQLCVCVFVSVPESDVTCHCNPDTREPNGEGALKHWRTGVQLNDVPLKVWEITSWKEKKKKKKKSHKVKLLLKNCHVPTLFFFLGGGGGELNVYKIFQGLLLDKMKNSSVFWLSFPKFLLSIIKISACYSPFHSLFL